MTSLRLGTRGSPLALFQANAVANLIHSTTGRPCEIVVIRTSGDRLAEAALSEIGGKRLFVKEIEDALLASTIDLAVHSSKDMPVVLPAGLSIAATLPREDPRDAIVLPVDDTGQTLESTLGRLGPAPTIGTSSVRRIAQLRRLLPGATFQPLRGNLDTRLSKLRAGHSDAIVLAAAGLIRLGHDGRIAARLPLRTCVPAPGQGIIAVETRSDDDDTRGVLGRIDDPPARAALIAERAVVEELGGGCQMPIGAVASIDGEAMHLTAIVASLDGSELLSSEERGHVNDAQTIGLRVARGLLAQGAARVLAAVTTTGGSGSEGA
jgi:hydroxymethylbilane synthase